MISSANCQLVQPFNPDLADDYLNVIKGGVFKAYYWQHPMRELWATECFG